MDESPKIATIIHNTLDSTINMLHDKLQDLQEVLEKDIPEESLLKLGIDKRHTDIRRTRLKDLLTDTIERNVKDEMIAILEEEVRQLREVMSEKTDKAEKDKDKLVEIVAVTKQEVKILTELVQKTIEEMNRYADMYEEIIMKLRGKMGTLEQSMNAIPRETVELKRKAEGLEEDIKNSTEKIKSLTQELETLKQANDDATIISKQLTDLQKRISEEQEQRNEIENERNELLREVDILKKHLNDYQRFLISKEEHNIRLRSLIEKMTDDSSSSNVKTLLDCIEFEERKNQSLLEKLEMMSGISDNKQWLKVVDEYKEQLELEKAKNKELNNIIRNSSKRGSSGSEDTVRKLTETIEKKNKEIQALKSELKIIREPVLFTEEMMNLREAYATEKRKSGKLENELDTLKRQWSMIFKQESGKQVERIRMEEEEIQTLRNKLEQLTEDNAISLQKERCMILEKEEEIQILRQKLADAAVQYSALSTNMKVQARGLGNMVGELLDENYQLKVEMDDMIKVFDTHGIKYNYVKTNESGSRNNTELLTNKDISEVKDRMNDNDTSENLSSAKLLLETLKNIGEAIENLDEVVAKTYSVNDCLKEASDFKNFIQLQKFGIETLMSDINKLMVADEPDFNATSDTERAQIIDDLKTVYSKLNERDDLRSSIFMKNVYSAMDEISKQITDLESQVNHFLNEGKATHEFLSNVGNQMRSNLVSVSEVFNNKENKGTERIECILLSIHQKFTTFSAFGDGESKIMDRFKIELLALYATYKEISNISGFDRDSELKKQLGTKRLLENVLKVKREVDCLEILDGQLYTSKHEAGDRRYLQAKIREMELMIEMQKKDQNELKTAIIITTEKIRESERKQREYELKYRNLEQALNFEKRKRNMLQRGLENEKEELKEYWKEEGKRELRSELSSSEPISVEAMKVHLEDALATELKVRLDLEHERYCRKIMERDLESIYLDMERTSMKGKNYLSLKEIRNDMSNGNVCVCRSKRNAFILNLATHEKLRDFFKNNRTIKPKFTM